VLSPKTQNLTYLFKENAQNDPKMHSYKDNTKFHCAFLGQRLAMLCAFRDNAEVQYIWANMKILKNVGYTAFCIYQ
jgi:hypothetical protein